jgi:nickel-type superoxide dismutase maturation protease
VARDGRPEHDAHAGQRLAAPISNRDHSSQLMRRLAFLAGTALFVALVVAAIRQLPNQWSARVAVKGHSMEPTLADGDWLLVDPLAYSARFPRAGELVVVTDPRDEHRLLVKRVGTVTDDGLLALMGDHPAHAVEMTLNEVDADAVVGRPWLRYWPFERFGPIA